MSIYSESAIVASLVSTTLLLLPLVPEDSALGLQAAIAAGHDSFDGLVKELETADDVKYAKAYRKWLKGT